MVNHDHSKASKAARDGEQALVREEHLLRTLMDSVPDGIYFKDADGRFLRVNRAVAERFGLTDSAPALRKERRGFFLRGSRAGFSRR